MPVWRSTLSPLKQLHGFVTALHTRGHCMAPAGANGRGTGLSLRRLSSHAPLAGKATFASCLQALGASLKNAMSLQRF